MNTWPKITKWIDRNRFIVIFPIISILIWITAASCTPVVSDPIEPSRQVDAVQLQNSFEVWQAEQLVVAKRYELAGKDLQRQAENNAKIENFIIELAAGGTTNIPALIQLLIGGGALGAITDNIRKRGLIAGLKRNA